MSEKRSYRCDACGDEFTQGMRVFTSALWPASDAEFAPTGVAWGIELPRAKADLCKRCVDAKVKVDAYGFIDHATVPTKTLA